MHTITASAATSGMRLPPLASADGFEPQAGSSRASRSASALLATRASLSGSAGAASNLRVTISAAGRQAALQAQRAEAVTVFAKMDSDHDGKVNSAEFDAAAGSPPTPASAPLRAAVKAYDDASPAALDNAAHTGATDLLA